MYSAAVRPPPAPSGLLLAPGASASRDQPALVAIDDAVSALGLVVERIDFPYRLAGRRWPDPPAVLIEAVRASARALAARARGASDGSDVTAGPDDSTETVVLGGRSMGGRVCSMAAAEGLPARGLVLVSYPLHPPGRPEKLRSEHFPNLSLPCLFVSGNRDTFASPAELEEATSLIPGPVALTFVDGDHGLKRRDVEVAALVADWIKTLR